MVVDHNCLPLPKPLKNLVYLYTYSQSLLFYYSPNFSKFGPSNTLSPIFRSSLSSLNSHVSTEKSKYRPRILFVADESRTSGVIKYGLEKYEFVVDVYDNPKSILSSFKPGVYDLLLIDVWLPGIDGLDLCNELLKIDDKVKVCFITAYELDGEEIRQRVSGLQTQCILKKPMTFDALVEKVNNQIFKNI